MFKFRTFLLSLIGVSAIICGSAFSYFIFNEEVSSSQVIEDQIKVDNIEENYVFGRDDYQGKDYTIYLFPSALYLEIYQDYLNDPSNIKPEDAFGYIEAVEDSSGNISYKQTLKQSSKGTYRDYVNNNYEYLDNYYDREVANQKVLGITINRANAYGYQIVYDLEVNGIGETGLNGGHNARSDFGEKDDTNGKGVIATKSSWDDYYIDQLGDFESGEFNYINFNSSQYNNRRHFKNDRFGFWPNLNYDEGRVLPQKIEVFESISQNDFSKLTMTPWTSMGDQEGWYELNFAMWTYVDFDGDGNPIYPCEVGDDSIEISVFRSKDINQFFDINKALSGFADEDNVIRLFPVFSNSKGYKDIISEGGRDALRIDIKDESGNSTRYPMLYFQGSEAGTTINGINNTNIGYVSNINITENITDLEIAIHPAESVGHWGGQPWAAFYGSNTSITGLSIINYIKNNYGLGLYNFYLVVGRNTTDSNSTSGFNNISTIADNVTSNLTVFKQIYNKNLSYISDDTNKGSGVLEYLFEDKIIFDTYIARPYILLVEKIAEASFYKELNSSYTDDKTFNADLNNQVDAPKFYNLNAKLYKATLNSSGAYVVDSTSELTENNSYIYLAQNVDLTEISTNLLMQIRFNNEYYNVDGGLYNLNPLNSNEALIFNPTYANNQFKYNDEDVFTNASLWFNTKQITIKSTNVTENALSLNDYENDRGIYDILIEYNKDSDQFNVYTYRHTNIFVKLFEDKSAISVDQNTGLAIHKDQNGNELTSLVWKKQYYLGVNMKNTDTCDISFNVNQISIQNAVNNFLTTNTKGYTKDNLLIRDYVTNSLVGYFDNNGNLVLNLRIMKNYILYISKKG